MREILFRGKCIDNGEWVEGYYCKWLKGERIITYSEKETDCIITWMSNGGMSRYEVVPETLCQFTGLYDKNDKRIWENDILMAHLDEFYPEDATYETVEWGVAGWAAHETSSIDREYGSVDREYLNEFDLEHFEVVGNIFDNQELLQEETR